MVKAHIYFKVQFLKLNEAFINGYKYLCVIEENINQF